LRFEAGSLSDLIEDRSLESPTFQGSVSKSCIELKFTGTALRSKYINNLTDLFLSSPVFKLWGGCSLVSMGDGIRFRVRYSPKLDYVYVRYLAGFDSYEVEFGALVGTEYDVLDRIKPVTSDSLLPIISKKVFFEN
jgi:hypothetical protein